jgi:drug/metabolite transporter (DMT)-like permease
MSSPRRRIGPKTWLLTAVVILANVLGNLSLKVGMEIAPAASSVFGVVRAVFTPFVLLGIALLILWLLTRLTLLSWADLTFVLPVTALGYVLTALIGRFFLHEDVSWQRWAGVLLIVAGTALVGTTYPRTTGPNAEDPS